MSDLEPITREEHYLSAIAGLTELPSDMTPITREEMFLQEILDNGGGGGGEATGTKEISITENGVTTHNIKAYATAEITTNVPNSYSASDEGKVVDDGALVSQTSKNITSNGTVDTTLNNSVVVNVPQGITPTGTKQISITENGTTTENVTDYANAEISVDVPVGEDVYFSPKGQQYTKDIYDTTTTGSPVTLENMEFVETIYREKANTAQYAGGYNLKNLKSVHYPQASVGNHFFIREQDVGGKLEEIILGSVGHPVTNITDSSWFYGRCANPCNVTIFVDATAMSGIPQNVLSYASGNGHSNVTVNVIFKSSTTGEVITA